LLSFLVPDPDNVTVTADDIQLVGQSLILECRGTIVRGVTSRVDIVWSNDGVILNSITGVSGILSQDNLPVYTATHVLQLNTDDEDKTYCCEIVINSAPPAMSTTNITLDVTGKYM